MVHGSDADITHKVQKYVGSLRVNINKHLIDEYEIEFLPFRATKFDCNTISLP